MNADRWPDIATVPSAPLRAAIAGAVIGRIARRLPLRIAYENGRVTGTTGPTMVLRRPEEFRARLGADGMIGLGEGYQSGAWECDDLPGLLTVLATDLDAIVPPPLRGLRHLHAARPPRAERNTVDGARSNIHRHYDLSNDLFALFLDDSMTYSSALFEDAGADLRTAQHRKIDRLLDRTGVAAGRRVLEIGTGWGELAIRAARRGARVVSVTLSEQQRVAAVRRVAEAGLADRVEIRLCDYREIAPEEGGFDAVVSVEMIEAVGRDYWPVFAAEVARHLRPGGIAGLQMITTAHERMVRTTGTHTWIQKYVFPGGLIPSVEAISSAFGRAGLTVRETFAFGPSYAQTLRSWRSTFLARQDQVLALGFDQTFIRTWDYYLGFCEAGFTAGYLDVCQLTATA